MYTRHAGVPPAVKDEGSVAGTNCSSQWPTTGATNPTRRRSGWRKRLAGLEADRGGLRGRTAAEHLAAEPSGAFREAPGGLRSVRSSSPHVLDERR